MLVATWGATAGDWPGMGFAEAQTALKPRCKEYVAACKRAARFVSAAEFPARAPAPHQPSNKADGEEQDERGNRRHDDGKAIPILQSSEPPGVP